LAVMMPVSSGVTASRNRRNIGPTYGRGIVETDETFFLEAFQPIENLNALLSWGK